ncbi:MAG: Gfo/Idh/MocA family oxidoreductase [Candidatus Erginobacter occultus]|nr:Gfo/Idh/MocA family oxidoreductase [Candidatus Erginobacter occultus]
MRPRGSGRQKEKTIGMGLIGCGGMGRVVPRIARKREKRVATTALCDPEERSLAAGLKELNPAARVYPDYRELVRAPEVDWVLIASWNADHCAHAVAAFEAGKDVFCQKPLATNLEDCLAIKAAWEKSGRAFFIGFVLRFAPHYQKIRRLLDRGVIGDIISLEFNETLEFNHGGFIMGDWRRLKKYAGSHLLEKCCHDIDLVNWYVGSLPRRVASFGGLDFFIPENRRHLDRLGKSSKGLPAYRSWGGLIDRNPFTSDKDIVDNQVAIIEYENNVRATFHTNCNAGIPERRMYILGTEGAIRADLLRGTIEVGRIGFRSRIRKYRLRVRGGHAGGDAVLGRALAACMTRGDEPPAGMMEALEASIACFAIDQAMESGRVVDLRPLWEKAGIEVEPRS